MTLAEATLETAKQYVGQKEMTGHNDGPFVQMIQRWLEGPNAHWMDGQPWCCAFATWCIHMAGAHLGAKPEIPPCGSSTELYQWFKNHGKLLTEPTQNCIGMIKSTGGASGKTHDHTFMVLDLDPDGQHVITVDGNWGNVVSKTRHLIAECDFGEIC